jgi:predicted TIM-barrel fold metal-dependent hydrolase
MVMPNLDQAQQFAQMEEMHARFGVAAWKCYTPWGPDGTGWWLDDAAVGIPFIEKGRELGVKIFCCHKGFPLPTFDAVHTDPRDIGVVAAMYPDVSFIVYHSAYQHGGEQPEGPYDPVGLPDTAAIGVNSLIKALEDNGIAPGSNVFAELGSLWGSVMTRLDEAQHVIGKLLKHVGEDNVVWGTDCIWTGTPQPQIEAFRAFSISTEMQDMYGYPALTDEIKRKILGLNAARVFGVDPAASRCAISQSQLEQARLLLDDELGPRRWAFRPPAGPRTRREFLSLIRSRGGRPG